MASRARHRNHLTERQCVCRGPQRRLDPDPGILGRSVAGHPRCAARLPGPQNDGLAVHTRCPGRRDSLSGRVFAR
jgi:hypothetical protein